MKITKQFIWKIFEATSMQRWNDQICPIEFRELDKQAHKTMIAYLLGHYEESNKTQGVDLLQIIEGGIFGLLQRLVITDLKPSLFHKIRRRKDKYRELNKYVFQNLKRFIEPIGKDFCDRFKIFLNGDSNTINDQILNAAHFYASKWEFEIIKRANPFGYGMERIEQEIQEELEKHYNIIGMQRFALDHKLRLFIDLCGQLRFQIRWSNLHRVPKTSVLGHMLIVAILSYLFSLKINACKKRLINNFYRGLYHDLPEVMTRDIIDPLKTSVEGIQETIAEYEEEEMSRIYKLLDANLCIQLKEFAQNKFVSQITKKGKRKPVSSNDICREFNDDKYNPMDGELVEAIDHLAAYVEACLAIENGVRSETFSQVICSLAEKYSQKSICGIDFGQIYESLRE